MNPGVRVDDLSDLEDLLQILKAAQLAAADGSHQGIPIAGAHSDLVDIQGQTDDVSHDLHPGAVLCTAADGHDAVRCRTVLPNHIQDLSHGIADTLQRRAVQVGSCVLKGQSEDQPSGIGVVDGAALPGQIGQRDQSVTPRGNAVCQLCHGGVGVPSARLLYPLQIREDVVPIPLGQCACGIGARRNRIGPGNRKGRAPDTIVLYQVVRTAVDI